MSRTSIDSLLNNRIQVEQPLEGYRLAVDTLLLAAAVPAMAGQTVADYGCGVGGVMLALAARVPNLTVTGIDIQPELVTLAQANITRNALPSTMAAVTEDVTRLPALFHNKFDHVIMNPPFHNDRQHGASANVMKRTANTEKDGDLKLWIENAFRALKTDGRLTLIHRADRSTEILELLKAIFGQIFIKPILSKETMPAKRVIICAQKNTLQQITTISPFILHNADGPYTAAANAVLRDIAGLDMFN